MRLTNQKLGWESGSLCCNRSWNIMSSSPIHQTLLYLTCVPHTNVSFHSVTLPRRSRVGVQWYNICNKRNTIGTNVWFCAPGSDKRFLCVCVFLLNHLVYAFLFFFVFWSQRFKTVSCSWLYPVFSCF